MTGEPVPRPAGKHPVVCQVLHSLCVGGAEILAARLARQLQADFRFVFVCLDDAGFLAEELTREGFPVHVLHRRPGLDWRLILRLKQLFRQEQVDVIHAHQYAPFSYCALARGWLSSRAIVFTEHGRHQPDFPRPKRIWANKFLLRRCDLPLGVGEAVRQALIRNEGLPAERVKVIYNGIDLTRFDPQAPLRSDVRRELGLAEDETVLMQVARLDYLKDHATALRAASQLRQAGRRVRLLIVGDGPERAGIERLREELGLAETVAILGQRTDIPRLIQAADIVLLTSISEGIPLTLIEGMAAGLPIVATDVGGVGEVVEHGVTGLLTPAQDSAQLAAAVTRLIDSPDERRRMGLAGRQRAERRFSEPDMHGQYSAAYRSLLRES